MPTAEDILGFSNRWYRDALNNSTKVELPCGASIQRVTAPYFLATKLAAFEGRGRGDFMMSHDIEDLIAVIDGRPGLVDEIAGSNEALRVHLSERFRALVDQRRFLDALPGHLLGDPASQARVPLILDRLRAIAASG